MIYLDGNVGTQLNVGSLADIGEDREIGLTTFGGSVYIGKGMYDYAVDNDLLDTIRCYGIVASAGTVILLSAKNRISAPHTKFLIHPPTTSLDGNYREMESIAAMLKEEEEWLVNFYVQHLKKDEQFIRSLMAENRTISAQEALDLGLITEIINFETMTENGVTKKDLEVFENSFLAKIKNFFNPKNMVVQSTDGTELEFDSGVETTNQIEVGQGLKAGGQPADGTFILADGTTITAEAGIITDVILFDATSDVAMDELKAENEALKTQVADFQNKLSIAETKVVTFQKLVNEVKTDFTKFKNQFSDDVPAGADSPMVPTTEIKKHFSYSLKQ